MLRKLLAPIVVLAGLGWGAAAAAEKPSIVLVHGLWADGSCYNAIIPSLEAAGYKRHRGPESAEFAEGRRRCGETRD
jgi:hypothetical protein